MSSYTKSKEFKCRNDCDPHGCPGHWVTVDYQTCSESLKVSISGPNPQELYIQTPELKALSDILRDFSLAHLEIYSAMGAWDE